jgi:hypothetical protein
MNAYFSDAEAGAMGCLQCGRLLTIGVACVCVDEPDVNAFAAETAFWRENNLWSIRENERPRKSA